MSDIRLNPDAADEVRKELASARNVVWWLELVALFVMPVFLGLLGNALVTQLYASTPDRLNITITIVLLVVCTGLQLVFGIAALRRGNTHSTIDDATLRTDIAELRKGIRRKSEVHQTLRASFDEYNAQVCNVSGWCENEFQQLLDHVFAPTRSTIDRVLGITDRVYTIEVYLDVNQIDDITIDWTQLEEGQVDRPTLGNTSLGLWYFYASERVNEELALRMGDRHPAVMAWSNHVPDEYSLDKHHQLYGTIQSPANDVYFRRVITVPIRVVCTPNDFWGTLVMTTMQREPIADDAIDNVQWLSSLTTNFIAAYNKCKSEQRQRLESERRSRGQRLRREREATVTTNDTNPEDEMA